MSQFGMNSIPIIDNNAMGGFRAGLDTMRGMDHSNSNLATEDLNRQVDQQKLDEARLDSPLKAAKRALELAQAESDTTDINKGGRDQDRQMMRDTKAAELASKINENQLNDLKKRITGVQAVGQIFGPEANPGTMARDWETARGEGKQYGFDIGEYSAEAAQRVLRLQAQTPFAMEIAKHAATKGIDTNERLITLGAENNYRSAEARKHEEFLAGQGKLSREAQERIARIHASNNGGGGSGQLSMTKLEAQYIQDVDAFANGTSSKPPSEAALTVYENKVIKDRGETKAYEVLMKLNLLSALNNPNDPQHAVAQKQFADMKRAFAANDPVVAEFRALRAKAAAARGSGGGGSVTPPAKTGSSDWGTPRVKGQ